MILPELETKRLILRKMEKQDVEAVFNGWMKDTDVSKYMFWEASNDINEAKEFIQFELGNIKNDRWNRWIIVTKEKHEIVGTCLLPMFLKN